MLPQNFSKYILKVKGLRRKLKIIIVSRSEQETQKIGRTLGGILAAQLDSGRFPGGLTVMLKGNLGAGKTCFVKGVADYIVPDQRVTSPSYTLINEYTSEAVKLVHADLYRMNRVEEVEYIGLYDYPRSRTILMIEWPEKVKDFWQRYVCLEIVKESQYTRKLEFEAEGEEENMLLEELSQSYDDSGD